MATGMGSFYVGVSGLQNSQNALNTTANNLANVDTKGYVRQQVIFADQQYITFNTTSAVSKQQAGLGVTIADVAHTRDQFLDRFYRTESGRQAFYEKNLEVINDMEDLFQELEGATYQQTLEDFWVSFQELAKQPDEGVNQNLVVQKATLFLEQAKRIYDNTISYQKNMNVQIEDGIERVNELGKRIHQLNKQIQTIEAGGIETAMTLRDERDNALDELSSLVKTSYDEDAYGVVRVKIEDAVFVDQNDFYEMGAWEDEVTGFITPYWPHLSDEERGVFTKVFYFENGVSSSNDTDLGSLKSLVLARGDKVADYTDLEGLSIQEYNNGLGQSIIMNIQAEFDRLIHTTITTINDILCPNTEVTFTAKNGKVYENVKVWDEEKGCVGADGIKPGHELFIRRGTERYTAVEGKDGKTYYVYNEEDPTDTSKQYGVFGVELNKLLLQEEAHLPHIKSNGEIDFAMAAELAQVWSKDKTMLNPTDTDPCSIKEFYQRMIDGIATTGSLCQSQALTSEGSANAIENQRQQVVGVSSDEELTNMIKYQNAYNAASRYINVISEMLEHLIMQLGS